MSHAYTPTAVNPPANYTVPDDGDLASVSSIDYTLRALDNIKFFKDRLDGTTAGVTLLNPTLNGTAACATITASVGCNIASTIVASAAAVALGNVPITCVGAVTMNSACTVQGVLVAQNDFDARSGSFTVDTTKVNHSIPLEHQSVDVCVAGGYRADKVVTGANVDNTVYSVISDADIVLITGAVTGDINYLIANEAVRAGARMRFYTANSIFSVTVKRQSDGVTLAVLRENGGASTYDWVDLINPSGAAGGWTKCGGQRNHA